MQHETHPAIVKRLKRIAGHLRAVIEMIEQGRPCLDLAQQLHAVERAVANAKKILIHDHIDRCLEHPRDKTGRNSRSSIQEFKELSKYL